MVSAALHVLETTGADGAAGKTTNDFVSVQFATGVVYVAVKHPAVVGVNTPVAGSMVPPPDTDQVPPVVPPACVKVTVLPPAHALEVVTVAGESAVIVALPDIIMPQPVPLLNTAFTL